MVVFYSCESRSINKMIKFVICFMYILWLHVKCLPQTYVCKHLIPSRGRSSAISWGLWSFLLPALTLCFFIAIMIWKTSSSDHHRLSCFSCYAVSAFLDGHLQKPCRVKPFFFFPVKYLITEIRKVIQCGKVLDKGCEYGLVFRLISCVWHVFCLHVCLYTMGIPVPRKVRRRHQIYWN